jgi:hypothetical protein
MPAYHMTTPDTDSENSSSNGKHSSPVSFVPSSGKALSAITDMQRTDQWVDEVVKYTLFAEESSPSPLQRKNTIDVKRHRVFSTTVDVQPRRSPSVKSNSAPKLKLPEMDSFREEVSSWIASEIFDIAKAQAEESENITNIKAESLEGCDNRDEGKLDIVDTYDDVESLMGEYFEDIKVAGSDAEE